jgi:hypothetical protein
VQFQFFIDYPSDSKLPDQYQRSSAPTYGSDSAEDLVLATQRNGFAWLVRYCGCLKALPFHPPSEQKARFRRSWLNALSLPAPEVKPLFA